MYKENRRKPVRKLLGFSSWAQETVDIQRGFCDEYFLIKTVVRSREVVCALLGGIALWGHSENLRWKTVSYPRKSRGQGKGWWDPLVVVCESLGHMGNECTPCSPWDTMCVSVSHGPAVGRKKVPQHHFRSWARGPPWRDDETPWWWHCEPWIGQGVAGQRRPRSTLWDLHPEEPTKVLHRKKVGSCFYLVPENPDIRQ